MSVVLLRVIASNVHFINGRFGLAMENAQIFRIVQVEPVRELNKFQRKNQVSTKKKKTLNNLQHTNFSVPKSSKLKKWKSCEVNGSIFVWHHAEDDEPWELPVVKEIGKLPLSLSSSTVVVKAIQLIDVMVCIFIHRFG